MGQNLSIRRPKISLTWVLREQQQQQQQQSQQQQQQQLHQNQSANDRRPPQINGNYLQPSSQSRRASPVKATAVAPAPSPPAPSSGSSNGAAVPARKKSRTRSKERLFSEKYVSDNNLTEYGYNEKLKAVHGGPNGGASAPASTEHHGSNGHHHHNGVYRKSNRSYRKNSDRLKKKEGTLVYPSLVQSETVDILLNNNNSIIINLNQEEQQQLLKEKSLKNTYSEPSLYTTVSEPSSSKNRHRHRRRRERYHRSASQRFGYEIQNVDEFLSKCSLSSPGNIPVVLAAAATLYQTRPGSYQIEIPLPLGMVVNAVFKNQNWLYVQTPHAEEGYVAYKTCLPLGILPPNQRSSSTSKPTPCWESNKDVFPRPSGNLTDSEKEIQQLRGGSNTVAGAGTRYEGRRTPRLKRNGTNSRSVASVACSSEKNLDSLYLRVANQPKSADSQSQFAQLKLTPKVLNGKSAAAAATAKLDKVLNMDQLDKLPSNGDYIQLHKPMQHNPQHQQQNPFHHHHHHKILVKSGSGGSGHSASSVLNGGHYHKTVNNVSYSNSTAAAAKTTTNGSANLRTSATTAVRQTLLAITDSYSSEAVSVQKGDVVTLLACKEYQEKGLKNYKQWFFVRTRDGHEGYIPAEAAGHGFL
ncbi:uncharacterized protein LOC6042820 [Culex quinquefasciatus]|uniref:uncharacterized protein LOC6042820 n=1 Tax=Culex quinquefasciatus TaxID=7176 RepID=UPI0018E2CD3C|nr:uncharacterized protein LOC6042820 [Culex quinquefasciatus]